MLNNMNLKMDIDISDLLEQDSLEDKQIFPVYLIFNKYAQSFFYRLKGTSFVYYTSRNVWAHDQSTSFDTIPFEKVFDLVMNDNQVSDHIKNEVVFKLDRLRKLPDSSSFYIKRDGSC